MVSHQRRQTIYIQDVAKKPPPSREEMARASAEAVSQLRKQVFVGLNQHVREGITSLLACNDTAGTGSCLSDKAGQIEAITEIAYLKTSEGILKDSSGGPDAAALRGLLGSPTTLIHNDGGRTLDTRTLSNASDHRVYNNRLKTTTTTTNNSNNNSSNNSSEVPTVTPVKRPAVEAFLHNVPKDLAKPDTDSWPDWMKEAATSAPKDNKKKKEDNSDDKVVVVDPPVPALGPPMSSMVGFSIGVGAARFLDGDTIAMLNSMVDLSTSEKPDRLTKRKKRRFHLLVGGVDGVTREAVMTFIQSKIRMARQYKETIGPEEMCRLFDTFFGNNN